MQLYSHRETTENQSTANTVSGSCQSGHFCERISVKKLGSHCSGGVMSSQRLYVMGLLLSVIGWLGTIITCGLPMWRVIAFIGCGIISYPDIWQGLWMRCVVQFTGQIQCRVYDLPQDLQAARAMVIISVIVGVFGIIVAIIGGKCTNCLEAEASKAKVCIVSGVIFLITALLTLIPVSWTAHAVITDFYDPLNDAQRRKLGASLYIGWASAGLLLLGGGLLLLGGVLLCRRCPPTDGPYTDSRVSYSSLNYVCVLHQHSVP